MTRAQDGSIVERVAVTARPQAPVWSAPRKRHALAFATGLARHGQRLADGAMWFGCVFTCVFVLRAMGTEGPWYRLHDAMSFDANPPFRHRVLFVLVARGVQAAHPALHDPRCYFVSQCVAAAIAFWAIRPWAARFMTPRSATLSRPLLLMLLVPTFTYWTFYDIGIVASTTLASWALVERRYGRYLAILALATLNHENSLLLVPYAVLMRFGSWRPARAVLNWAGLQLGVYLALRAALFAWLPVRSAWQGGKLAYNLHLVAHEPAAIARTVMLLGAWTLVAVVGWSRLPREIRWAFLILGPELFLVTLLFGQFNELRQFDALLPMLVVAMLAVFGTARSRRARAESGPGTLR